MGNHPTTYSLSSPSSQYRSNLDISCRIHITQRKYNCPQRLPGELAVPCCLVPKPVKTHQLSSFSKSLKTVDVQLTRVWTIRIYLTTLKGIESQPDTIGLQTGFRQAPWPDTTLQVTWTQSWPLTSYKAICFPLSFYDFFFTPGQCSSYASRSSSHKRLVSLSSRFFLGPAAYSLERITGLLKHTLYILKGTLSIHNRFSQYYQTTHSGCKPIRLWDYSRNEFGKNYVQRNFRSISS